MKTENTDTEETQRDRDYTQTLRQGKCRVSLVFVSDYVYRLKIISELSSVFLKEVVLLRIYFMTCRGIENIWRMVTSVDYLDGEKKCKREKREKGLER